MKNNMENEPLQVTPSWGNDKWSDPYAGSQRNAESGSDAPTCSPLRVAYSREDMESKLREWMVKEFGHPRDYINDPDQRNAWYRDNGLLYHFICDHFPAENA